MLLSNAEYNENDNNNNNCQLRQEPPAIRDKTEGKKITILAIKKEKQSF